MVDQSEMRRGKRDYDALLLFWGNLKHVQRVYLMRNNCEFDQSWETNLTLEIFFNRSQRLNSAFIYFFFSKYVLTD